MRLKQVAVALDQLVNAICGGWADETLSARSYRNRCKKKRWMWMHNIINFIFFWEPQHCMYSWIAEKARNQLPIEYRDIK